MTTITLDRSSASNDFLFAALNDGAYADLKKSQEMEAQRNQWETTETQTSLGARVREFFFGK